MSLNSTLIKSEIEHESSCDEEVQEVPRIPRITELSTIEARKLFIKSIKNENCKTLKKLLKHRVDIDINMNNGWPLLYAIENGCISMVKVLISQAEINLNIQSGKPLLAAVEYEQYKIFKMLIEAGADTNFCCYRLMEVIKEAGDSRYKFHLTRKGFTQFYAHIPSYIRK